MNNVSTVADASAACPQCSRQGRRVGLVTLRSLLTTDAVTRIDDREYRYCDSAECRTVYFDTADTMFTTDDLTVRVGAKEADAPRPICYCFDYTIEDIEQQILETGGSSVVSDIKHKMQDGCWCDTKSPQGTCCLGSVAKCVSEVCKRAGVARSYCEPEHVSCCGPDNALDAKATSNGTGHCLTAGAVLSAILASACCWLPLLLLALGVSAAGVSAAFEKVRPFFLGIAAILLGCGFYFAYFRPQRCAPSGECATSKPRLNRFNRAMLWCATAAVVAFAFFPSYVGLLLAHDESTIQPGQQTIKLDVSGMTCEGCASHVHKALTRVPGVVGVDVTYADGRVTVATDPTSPPTTKALLEAIEEAGYKVSLAPANP